MTGIAIARELSKMSPEDNILILEKSKGLGGRLATRRGEKVRFDHGIPLIEDFDLGSLPFSASASRREGATAIAKALASDLRIEKNTRAVRIEADSDAWQVTTDGERVSRAKNVILTAPLPQAIELLSESLISVPEGLKTVVYDPAVVALIEGDAFQESGILTRFQDSPFLTLVNEQKKGISQKPAWTLTFSPAWSKEHFELGESELRAAVLSELLRLRKGFDFPFEVKKWRYSRPINPLQDAFFELSQEPGLYLAGDGFCGGHSSSHLKNAIESGLSLVRGLKKQGG